MKRKKNNKNIPEWHLVKNKKREKHTLKEKEIRNNKKEKKRKLTYLTDVEERSCSLARTGHGPDLLVGAGCRRRVPVRLVGGEDFRLRATQVGG